MVSSVHRDLNSESGFSLNPVPVSHRGRDVCGFPTGMRRPDPCTTHYMSHTLYYIYTRYTMHDTRHMIHHNIQHIIHHTHICNILYTLYSIHTDTTVVVMLGGEGGIGPARWSRNWFCPAAQGQIRYTTVQGQKRYTTAQGQIRFTTVQGQIRYTTLQGQIRTQQGQIRYTTLFYFFSPTHLFKYLQIFLCWPSSSGETGWLVGV